MKTITKKPFKRCHWSFQHLPRTQRMSVRIKKKVLKIGQEITHLFSRRSHTLFLIASVSDTTTRH